MWKALAVLFLTGGVMVRTVGRSPLLLTEFKSEPPSTQTSAGFAPHEILEKQKNRPMPKLYGSGEEARRSAHEFLAWASASTVQEAESVRSALAGARENVEIAQSFCEEAQHARMLDHTRALVALALLGEMKSEQGEKCFLAFLAIPPPVKGTVVDGEIVERTALATLQAKAVDGLAFLRTPRSQEELFRIIREHPLRTVRAEAINSYLWNNQDSSEAKAELRKIVNKDDQVFIDRVRHNSGEKAESFNRKLAEYLRAHPEAVAPPPVKSKGEEKDRTERKQLQEPPKF